jgi:hypothetical protein
MYSSYRGGLRIPRMLNALFTFSTDRNSRGTEKNKNESIASVRLLLPRTPNVKSRMLDIIRRDGDKLIIFDGDLEMRAIWYASQKSVLRYSTLENAVTFITGGLIPFVGRFQSSSKNNYSQAVSCTVATKYRWDRRDQPAVTTRQSRWTHRSLSVTLLTIQGSSVAWFITKEESRGEFYSHCFRQCLCGRILNMWIKGVQK